MIEEIDAMAAAPSIDPARFLHEHLAQASPDLLRSLLTTMIDTLMSAEADAVCGAGHGERSGARVNHRNGYRHRDFDTARARWMWPSRSCVRAATSRIGCSSVAAAPKRP
jgi:hypothetical protein